MSKDLTKEEAYKIRVEIENIAADLSTLAVFMQYLEWDIEDAVKIIRGNKEYKMCDLSDRIATMACHISMRLQELTEQQYKIVNEEM